MRFYEIIISNKLASDMFTSGERVYNVIGGLPEEARLVKCELTERQPFVDPVTFKKIKLPNMKLTFVTDESASMARSVGMMNNPIQLKPVMGKDFHQ